MRWGLVWLVVAVAFGLVGCKGGTLSDRLDADGNVTPAPSSPTGQANVAQPAGPARTAPKRQGPSGVFGKTVALNDRDLAPVDAYFSARNAQWILGDNVDIVASKEYFAQKLTMNARVGLVHRSDSQQGDDTIVTMTYIGHPGQASAMTNPRVLIGTGLTITARKTLRLRLTKTTDPKVPVRLQVTATGDAVRGRGQKASDRNTTLQMGGVVRREGSRWVWRPRG